MSDLRKLVFTFVAAVGVAACASPVLAGVRYSEYAGGQQFWVSADSFSARSMDGGSPNYYADPAANSPLSGSAYYFGQQSLGGEQKNWWVQYDVPRAALPAAWNVSGWWGVWFRSQIPSAEEYGAYAWGGPTAGNPDAPDLFWDSDYLFVNGHSSDLDVDNPSEANWQSALNTRSNVDDRVLQNFAWVGREDGLAPHAALRPNWVWFNTQAPDDRTFLAKELKVHNGNISFRLYEREASVYNARIDTIVFAFFPDPENPNYVPTDADYLSAAPEPATALLVLLALPLMRRRR
jgi:hypothetical protein